MLYGGYPKPVLTEDKEEKIHQLKEIYTSYIEKDIKNFLKIENVPKFNKQKEITKSPKIYFQDPGLRNFSVKDFRILELREDKSKLVELAILSEIVKNLSILQEVFLLEDPE